MNLLVMAVLGGLLGPVLAQLSRVLATRDPLLARASWQKLDPRPPGMVRVVGCTVGNAAAFAVVTWRWPDSPAAVVFSLLGSALLVAAVIDVEHYRLPDRITYPAMAIGAALGATVALVSGDSRRLISLALGAVLFWGALGLGHLLSPAGLGRGDVKLGVTLGLAVGWVAPEPADSVRLVLLAFFVASLLGTLQGVVLLILRRRSAAYPFGPALAAGAMVVVLLSRRMVGA